MSNNYRIPEKIEQRIRERDTSCVYCGKKMLEQWPSDNSPTIEHLRETPPFKWGEGSEDERLKEEHLAICCWGCNRNRGALNLLKWFPEEYCTNRNINKDTVAEPVKNYIKKYIEKSER